MKRSVILGFATVMCAVSGCMISASSRSTTSGNYISPQIYDRVEDSQTTKDWLLDHFGPATETIDRGDGMEDMIYECTERVREHASIIFLISVSNAQQRTEQAVFELKDGIVQQHYRKFVEDFDESDVD